jgi:2-polyprenyl-3-methyl-5-hydroxy-6-metoxy-1,4-benzoquinol methylase
MPLISLLKKKVIRVNLKPTGCFVEEKKFVCNLCQGKDFKFLYPGNIDHERVDRFSQYTYYSDLYQCNNCELIIQKLDHEIEGLIKKISEEEYFDEEIGKLNIEEKHIQFNQLIKIMEKYGSYQGKKVLDAGANTGVFLSLMKKHTHHIFGVEPSTEAVQTAKNIFNIEIQNSVIGQSKWENDFFDMITMWDVIEHLYDPKGDLSFLHSKLQKGGRIFISTHNIGDFLLPLLGPKYPLFMYQHFFHFSKKTLARLLKDCGFEVLETHSFCKSWSMGYLYELIDKQWPNHWLGGFLKTVLSPLKKSKFLSTLILKFPVPHFFVIVAEKVDHVAK